MRTGTIITVSMLVILAVLAETREPLDPSQLRTFQFTRSDNTSRQNLSLYPEITTCVQLLRAYEGGASAVKTYRDPILTRGAKGIALFRSASPAVVLVVVGRLVNGKFDPTGQGTGAIVDQRGYVVTNWHVVHGANAGVVFMKPTSGDDLEKAPAFVAQLVYESATQDLALLKLVNAPQNLPFLKIGDVSQVQVAEDIHIIGHPHGKYWSYSTGVVSQVRTSFTWSYSDGSSHRAKVLQMQTAISPGNSGGPVLDDSGTMIGLVAMSGEEGLNYAVAADEITSFLTVGMSVRTRGIPEVGPAAKPSSVFSAKDTQGRGITKLVYTDLDLYVLEDAEHALALYVETRDGFSLSATNPDRISGFNTWLGTLPNGQRVLGTGTSGRLDKMVLP